jgi:hypothetical protein
LTLWKSGPTTLFGKRHYVDGRESLTFYDSFSAWSSRKVDASVSVFAKFYDPLVKVAVPPGGAWVHAAGLGSFRLVYDHAGRRLDWRTVPMAGEHGGMFSVDADDSRFQVTPTSLPTSPVWFAMSPVDSFEYHINGLQRVVVMKRLAGIRTYTNKIRGVQLPSAASK